ncbi:ATP-binding protein [Sphaerisporangium sp. NPDC051011]|uniref:ATP-binding protein n=1 Tax=Sphaerisporangium sp. NPDC051011 TaxID=3155792 RepID=UPI0033FF7616
MHNLDLVVRRDGPAGSSEQRAADTAGGGELDLEGRMSFFVPVKPLYDMSQLVLPAATIEELHIAVDTVRLRGLVFDTWGLRAIEPHPRSAISLHGGPGTGKTMTAHALAHLLGRPILLARTSQLESKYHGEGGKYLAALFEAARRADAVLFIDEAESLLSRRFESVSQGSEHAVNTLRAELIQHLDVFEGIAVFVTNLVTSYDPAISSRLHHVRIPEPDHAARRAIWAAHLPPGLPLATDVSVDELAETEGVVGRDVKRAVINAAVTVAREGRGQITHADLARSLANIIAARPAAAPDDGEVSEAERDSLNGVIRGRLARDPQDG